MKANIWHVSLNRDK